MLFRELVIQALVGGLFQLQQRAHVSTKLPIFLPRDAPPTPTLVTISSCSKSVSQFLFCKEVRLSSPFSS